MNSQEAFFKNCAGHLHSIYGGKWHKCQVASNTVSLPVNSSDVCKMNVINVSIFIVLSVSDCQSAGTGCKRQT